MPGHRRVLWVHALLYQDGVNGEKHLADMQPKVAAGSIESSDGEMQRSAPGFLLSTMCGLVLSGVLVAGLWPFHAPLNGVSWSSQGNGLIFGRHGSIRSVGSLKNSLSQTKNSCSIEVWAQPSRVDSGGTILAIYRPTKPLVPFVLRQFVSGLELQRRTQDPVAKNSRIYVADVFAHLKPVFLSISSGEKGTSIYVDGMLVKRSANFKFSGQDLSGQLLLGNSPSTSNNWSGQLKGLAVYNRELTAAEVSQHFADWTAKDPKIGKDEGMVVGYLFNEGKGNIVHNLAVPETNLFIPDRYFVINEKFLERPSTEFHSRWSYWEDVGVNIVGFIPFGFCFRAYFSAIRQVKRATGATIALGFAVSLTIEVLQGFLPTRDSGMTDLFTNTFGTALGAMLCDRIKDHKWFLGRPPDLLRAILIDQEY
jgi:VanZ family protein